MHGQSIVNGTGNSGSTIHFSKVCVTDVMYKASMLYLINCHGFSLEFYLVSLHWLLLTDFHGGLILCGSTIIYADALRVMISL